MVDDLWDAKSRLLEKFLSRLFQLYRRWLPTDMDVFFNFSFLVLFLKFLLFVVFLNKTGFSIPVYLNVSVFFHPFFFLCINEFYLRSTLINTVKRRQNGVLNIYAACSNAGTLHLGRIIGTTYEKYIWKKKFSLWKHYEKESLLH